MVSSLQKAFEHAQRLPDAEQEFIAAIIEEELADEARWQEKLRATLPELKMMEQRAREQFERGECLEGFDHE